VGESDLIHISQRAGIEPVYAPENMIKEVITMKWVCDVCGYETEGDTPPDECPVCGVDSSHFEQQ
jgi:rubrerythrin